MNPKPQFRVWDLDAVHVLWARRLRMHLFCVPWAQYLIVNVKVCLDHPHRSVIGQRKKIPLSLKIFFGADVSSCGLSLGTALWLSGALSGRKKKKGDSDGKEVSESFKRERNQDVPCVTEQQRLHLKGKSGTKRTISLWNLLLLCLKIFI